MNTEDSRKSHETVLREAGKIFYEKLNQYNKARAALDVARENCNLIRKQCKDHGMTSSEIEKIVNEQWV